MPLILKNPYNFKYLPENHLKWIKHLPWSQRHNRTTSIPSRASPKSSEKRSKDPQKSRRIVKNAQQSAPRTESLMDWLKTGQESEKESLEILKNPSKMRSKSPSNRLKCSPNPKKPPNVQISSRIPFKSSKKNLHSLITWLVTLGYVQLVSLDLRRLN